jgi:hypothetical protein
LRESQRQSGRQRRVVPIALQTRPGAQSAPLAHESPSVFVRVGPAQAQST